MVFNRKVKLIMWTNFTNLLIKVINKSKTKYIEFDSEYQFTLRLLEKKRKCNELTRGRKLKEAVENKRYESQLSWMRQEEKKKSGILCSWLFQIDFFFSRLEQLCYWEDKKTPKL